jgi:hypothetical protein
MEMRILNYLMIGCLALSVLCGCQGESKDKAKGNTNTKNGASTGDPGAKSNGTTATSVVIPQNIKDRVYSPFAEVNMTAAQIASGDALIAPHVAELERLNKEHKDLFDSEEGKKRLEAMKKAKQEGQDVEQASLAVIGPEKQKKMNAIDEAESNLLKNLRKEIRKLFTKEQLAKLKEEGGGK